MSNAAHPSPPWEQFPGHDPTWGGWRQGPGEAWLLDRWLPFWRALGAAGQDAYLIEHPPPDDLWMWYLRQAWR